MKVVFSVSLSTRTACGLEWVLYEVVEWAVLGQGCMAWFAAIRQNYNKRH